MKPRIRAVPALPLLLCALVLPLRAGAADAPAAPTPAPAKAPEMSDYAPLPPSTLDPGGSSLPPEIPARPDTHPQATPLTPEQKEKIDHEQNWLFYGLEAAHKAEAAKAAEARGEKPALDEDQDPYKKKEKPLTLSKYPMVPILASDDKNDDKTDKNGDGKPDSKKGDKADPTKIDPKTGLPESDSKDSSSLSKAQPAMKNGMAAKTPLGIAPATTDPTGRGTNPLQSTNTTQATITTFHPTVDASTIAPPKTTPAPKTSFSSSDIKPIGDLVSSIQFGDDKGKGDADVHDGAIVIAPASSSQISGLTTLGAFDDAKTQINSSLPSPASAMNIGLPSQRPTTINMTGMGIPGIDPIRPVAPVAPAPVIAPPPASKTAFDSAPIAGPSKVRVKDPTDFN